MGISNKTLERLDYDLAGRPVQATVIDKINELVESVNELWKHEHRNLARGGPHPDMNYDDYMEK